MITIALAVILRPFRAASLRVHQTLPAEIKHDGYRLMVRRDGERVRCFIVYHRRSRMGEKQMSKSYRLLGVMLVTATFAYLASKIGALSWGELIVIVAVANLGLQMMAGMNILKWSDDS